MNLSVLSGWDTYLRADLDAPYFRKLVEQVDIARKISTIFPPEASQFSAFTLTQPEQVRVVILGQDPYHGLHQANGLAFSVEKGIAIPPSLRNIYQELSSDLGCVSPKNGDLTPWAREGVFLLNTVLTVEAHLANSHKTLGWQQFTDAVVTAIGQLPQPIVFVLWGAQAQKKAEVAADSRYPRLILQAPHPSPLSSYRGFFGSRPFSKINEFLVEHGEKPIQFIQ